MQRHEPMRRTFGRTPARAAAALAVSLALFMLACAPARAFDGETQKFKPGDTAPDFTLKNLDGADVSLSDYAGKDVVLLVFFALRCGTCLAEAPHIEAIHQKFGGQGAVVLAVNTDGVDSATAAQTMKDVGFDTTYTVLLDPEFTATDTYTNFLVPLTLVIDKKGIVRFIHTGFEPGDEKKYEKEIKKAL